MTRSRETEQFIEMVKNDKELGERVRKAASFDEVIAIAAEKGIKIPAADIHGALQPREISASELDSLAGGREECGSASTTICYAAFGEGKWG